MRARARRLQPRPAGAALLYDRKHSMHAWNPTCSRRCDAGAGSVSAAAPSRRSVSRARSDAAASSAACFSTQRRAAACSHSASQQFTISGCLAMAVTPVTAITIQPMKWLDAKLEGGACAGTCSKTL